MVYKCVNRVRTGNRIVSYALQDEDGGIISVSPTQLKKELSLNPLNFSNLVLTKNNRVIMKEVKSSQLDELKRLYKGYPEVIQFCKSHKEYIQSMLDWEREGVACGMSKEEWIKETLPDKIKLKRITEIGIEGVLKRFIQNRRRKNREEKYVLGVDWGITSGAFIPQHYRCYYIDTTEVDEDAIAMDLMRYLYHYNYREEAGSIFSCTPIRAGLTSFKTRVYINAAQVEDEEYRIYNEVYGGSSKYFRDKQKEFIITRKFGL